MSSPTAERAPGRWRGRGRLWHQAEEAWHLFTPAGELNTRARAEAVLAEAVPQLPDGAGAKTGRRLRRPGVLRYLGRVQQQVAARPRPEAVKQAAVRQEGLRRRPEAL